MIGSFVSDRLGDWNPQLLREIQGRCKTPAVLITAAIAVAGQILLWLGYRTALPESLLKPLEFDPLKSFSNRYCLGSPPVGWQGYRETNAYIPDNWCLQDLRGEWILNWQLWWFDLFALITSLGIVLLIAVGSYLLISNLTQEQQRGTLTFLRLSPQPASSILLGKAIGVPILLYFFALAFIPLHLWAGLSAGISLPLILGFYGVIIASLAFFYNLALLLGLTEKESGFWLPFLGINLIFVLFLPVISIIGSGRFVFHTPGDGFFLFYPGAFFSYLKAATYLPDALIHHSSDYLANLQWYGQFLWKQPLIGMAIGILHYGLWIFWLGQCCQRRFYHPHAPLLTKAQSYGVTICIVAIALGFCLQTLDSRNLTLNYSILQAIFLAWSLVLGFILAPKRQTLLDWSRYRHHAQQKGLVRDLIWGEKSPAFLAIGINGAIFITFLIPSLLIVTEDQRGLIFLRFVSSLSLILLYMAVYQRLSLFKSRKLGKFLTLNSFAIALFLAVLTVKIMRINPSHIFLFSGIPFLDMLNISPSTIFLSWLGQGILTVLLLLETRSQLRRLGASATQALLSHNLPLLASPKQ